MRQDSYTTRCASHCWSIHVAPLPATVSVSLWGRPDWVIRRPTVSDVEVSESSTRPQNSSTAENAPANTDTTHRQSSALAVANAPSNRARSARAAARVSFRVGDSLAAWLVRTTSHGALPRLGASDQGPALSRLNRRVWRA